MCPHRKVLQKLLQGGMLEADPQAKREWQAIQQAFSPPEGFRMKVGAEAGRVWGGRGRARAQRGRAR